MAQPASSSEIVPPPLNRFSERLFVYLRTIRGSRFSKISRSACAGGRLLFTCRSRRCVRGPATRSSDVVRNPPFPERWNRRRSSSPASHRQPCCPSGRSGPRHGSRRPAGKVLVTVRRRRASAAGSSGHPWTSTSRLPWRRRLRGAGRRRSRSAARRRSAGRPRSASNSTSRRSYAVAPPANNPTVCRQQRRQHLHSQIISTFTMSVIKQPAGRNCAMQRDGTYESNTVY